MLLEAGAYTGPLLSGIHAGRTVLELIENCWDVAGAMGWSQPCSSTAHRSIVDLLKGSSSRNTKAIGLIITEIILS